MKRYYLAMINVVTRMKKYVFKNRENNIYINKNIGDLFYIVGYLFLNFADKDKPIKKYFQFLADEPKVTDFLAGIFYGSAHIFLDISKDKLVFWRYWDLPASYHKEKWRCINLIIDLLHIQPTTVRQCQELVDIWEVEEDPLYY